MACWTMAERVACWWGPVMRVSAGSTLWAARKTAISASRLRWSSSRGRAQAGAVAAIPGAGGGADVVGEFADEFGALLQVARPGRVGGEHVGDGGQPAQRSQVCCGVAGGGRQAPVQDGGGVVGVAERGVGGLVQGRDGVVSFDGQQGEVAAQHGPGLGVGEVVA